jgi:3-methyladenine DNA glycosylase/8-oxoguanine DNA glycosylase
MPTPHRTAVILSALINYVAFCGTNCSRADYIKEQAEAVHEERKRVAKQLERESAAVEKLKCEPFPFRALCCLEQRVLPVLRMD